MVRPVVHGVIPGLIFVLVAGSPLPALADNCKSSGGLTYLGNTRDSSRSVWLSRTDEGSFSLEAAQGNQTVDSWGVPPQRRLHLSTSPVVSSGNGGTHKLLETSGDKPCQVDTHNQKRDFTIPPNFVLPDLTLPVRPPIGNLFPDFNPPTLPGAARPPIATLPPGGVMPGVPGGVRPPVATLPPGGVTPGVPGGVRPPVATLPPGGVTPGVPGGVRPPVGTLPPTGAMPTLPGGVRPPIATLPPGGVTPGVPGAVRPPVGTLPPAGVMPGVPGGVQPPVATLPPGGVTPGAPGGVQPPGGTLSPTGQGVVQRTAGPALNCIDPRSPVAKGQEAYKNPICPPELLAEAAAQSREVPLTEGRELGPPKLWNAWVQPLFVQISDERFGLDMETQMGSVTVGLDRRMGENVVLGASLTVQNSLTEGFGDLLKARTSGFSIGPYLAVRLSPHWAIDTSVTYGQYDNDLELSVLEGSYQSRQWSGNVTAHGQYRLGEYFVRPKASISYSHIKSDEYDLQGNVLSFPVDISFPEDSFNFGIIDASTEFSRIYTFPGGTSVMPYAEIGATYEFERPNGGQILTADLELATPSPWAGYVRSGVRMLLNSSVQVEASGGYLSFGQSGLDTWEGKFQVSFGF